MNHSGLHDSSPMSLEEFRDLLARCGERPDGWPVQDRPRAAKLLDVSAEARTVLDDYQTLRHEAKTDSPAKAPAGLVDRILAKTVGASDRKKT